MSVQKWEYFKILSDKSKVLNQGLAFLVSSILEDITKPKGITAANPHLGKGGIVQNYVPDFEQALREGKIVPLLDTDTINNLEGKNVWIKSLGKELEVTFDPVKLLEKDASGNYKYATICSVGDSIKADGNAIVLDNKYIVNDISTLTMEEFTKYGKNGLDIDKINIEIGEEIEKICKKISKVRGGMQ